MTDAASRTTAQQNIFIWNFSDAMNSHRDDWGCIMRNMAQQGVRLAPRGWQNIDETHCLVEFNISHIYENVPTSHHWQERAIACHDHYGLNMNTAQNLNERANLLITALHNTIDYGFEVFADRLELAISQGRELTRVPIPLVINEVLQQCDATLYNPTDGFVGLPLYLTSGPNMGESLADRFASLSTYRNGHNSWCSENPGRPRVERALRRYFVEGLRRSPERILPPSIPENTTAAEETAIASAYNRFLDQLLDAQTLRDRENAILSLTNQWFEQRWNGPAGRQLQSLLTLQNTNNQHVPNFSQIWLHTISPRAVCIRALGTLILNTNRTFEGQQDQINPSDFLSRCESQPAISAAQTTIERFRRNLTENPEAIVTSLSSANFAGPLLDRLQWIYRMLAESDAVTAMTLLQNCDAAFRTTSQILRRLPNLTDYHSERLDLTPLRNYLSDPTRLSFIPAPPNQPRPSSVRTAQRQVPQQQQAPRYQTVITEFDVIGAPAQLNPSPAAPQNVPPAVVTSPPAPVPPPTRTPQQRPAPVNTYRLPRTNALLLPASTYVRLQMELTDNGHPLIFDRWNPALLAALNAEMQRAREPHREPELTPQSVIDENINNFTEFLSNTNNSLQRLAARSPGPIRGPWGQSVSLEFMRFLYEMSLRNRTRLEAQLGTQSAFQTSAEISRFIESLSRRFGSGSGHR